MFRSRYRTADVTRHLDMPICHLSYSLIHESYQCSGYGKKPFDRCAVRCTSKAISRQVNMSLTPEKKPATIQATYDQLSPPANHTPVSSCSGEKGSSKEIA